MLNFLYFKLLSKISVLQYQFLSDYRIFQFQTNFQSYLIVWNLVFLLNAYDIDVSKTLLVIAIHIDDTEVMTILGPNVEIVALLIHLPFEGASMLLGIDPDGVVGVGHVHQDAVVVLVHKGSEHLKASLGYQKRKHETTGVNTHIFFHLICCADIPAFASAPTCHSL